MKSIQNKILIFLAVILVTFTCKIIKNAVPASKTAEASFTQSSRNNSKPTSIKEEYLNWLEIQEKEAWAQLAKAGIEKSVLFKQKNKFAQTIYAKKEARALSSNKKEVPTHLKETAQSIAHDLGYTKEIKGICLETDEPIAAAALNTTLLFNPTILNDLSNKAQSFVLAHEVFHLIHEDDLIYDLIVQELAHSSLKAEQIETLLCSFSEFIEIRADILAALSNDKYLNGMIEYLEIGLKKVGIKKTPGYPLLSDRLEHAKKIKEGLSRIEPNLVEKLVTPEKSNNEIYLSWLEKEEATLWLELAKEGVSKALFEEAYEKYAPVYKQFNRGTPEPEGISKATIDLCKATLKEFGIDPTTISYEAITELSPIGTDDYSIMINDKLFKDMPLAARKFTIAHEAQHIKYKDDSVYFVLEQLLNPKGDMVGTDHILNRFSRFIEIRADVLAAIKNENYAQGFTDFIEYVLKKLGENPPLSHPTKATRLTMAKNIINHEPLTLA